MSNFSEAATCTNTPDFKLPSQVTLKAVPLNKFRNKVTNVAPVTPAAPATDATVISNGPIKKCGSSIPKPLFKVI